MKDYHLLLACDKHYLPYMFVACQSVLNGIKNSDRGINDDERVIFNVIIDSSVDLDKTKTLANSFCKRNDFIHAQFYFHNTSGNEFTNVRGWGEHKTKTTFYRLLINRFIAKEVSKFIYIDIDVLVLGDIRDLLSIDLANNILGTVYDHTCYLKSYKDGSISIPPTSSYKSNHVVKLSESNYFNAGVLLINMDQWRQKNIESKSIEFLNIYNPVIADQDALNATIPNHLDLDWSWNFQTWMFYIDKEQYTDTSGYVHIDSNKNKHQFNCNFLPIETVKRGLNGCNIIHFTACKPWKEHPFIAIDDPDRCILFNEQVVKSIQMWQEVARQTPECQGVNIPHTTIESVLGDLANHNAHNIYRVNQKANNRRRKLRKLFLILFSILAILQVITIMLLM